MMESRVTRITVAPKGEPIFSQEAFEVSINDEAGGEFLVVKSNLECLDAGEIRINKDEWPALRGAINRIFDICRGGE